MAIPCVAAFSDVTRLRSYSLHGSCINKQNCIHEIRPRPRDANEEEDDVELFYPVTRRAFMFDNVDDSQETVIIDIRQTSFGCGKLGATIWPSSIALACLLATHEYAKELVNRKRVIELGAGCGLPSAYLARNGQCARILATDYWEEDQTSRNDSNRLIANKLFGSNLIYNVQQSKELTNASVERLDWHDEMNVMKIASNFSPDTIIGSDLVYYPIDIIPLLSTLEKLFKAGRAQDALLISPLPPMSEREALPEFRQRLEDGELGDDFEVHMDELELLGRKSDADGSDEERYNLLRVRIRRRS